MLAFKQSPVDKSNAHYWVPLRNVDLGPTVTADLACLESKVERTSIDTFRQTCRLFYITLCDQINERFPFQKREVRMLKNLGFLSPGNFSDIKSISDVASFFSREYVEIDLEYKRLRRSHLHDSPSEIEQFWMKVKQSQDYPLLTELVQTIFVLPHSSAAVERTFSIINLNKTRTRNRLSLTTLGGILHSSELGNIYELSVDEYLKMIKRMNSDMYDI